MINNPWRDLENHTMKRVNSKNKLDIYWLKGIQGNFCLLFKVNNEFSNFKNIETKEFQTKSSSDNLIIELRELSNWEIFKIFCDDIILNIESDKNNQSISTNLYNRITQWKDLLKGKMKKMLSLEEQIGLFGELLVLKDIILKNNKSIDFWRGPEKDLQDFLCKNCAIEVKSSLSSKNKIITISSKNQLETEKNYLFLIYYSLTKDDNGVNLSELISSIEDILVSVNSKNIFLKKLLELGYNFDEDYFSFILDGESYYEVTNKFPKLNSNGLDSRITEVKYKLDLKQCEEFKINKEKILEEL